MLCQQMKTKRRHSRHNLQKNIFIRIVSLFLSITISDAFNLHTNIIINDINHHQIHHVSYRGVRIKTQQLFSASPNSEFLYNLDAIEDEIIRVKPLNKKSSKKSKSQKKKAKTEVVGQGTLPTEPTAKKNKKKGNNKSIKSIVSAESTSDMPPWLSQYENEDFSSPYHLSEELQSVSYEKQQQQNTEIQRLQLALNGIIQHEYPSSSDAIIPYFTPSEIHEIMDSIRVASDGNISLMKGCADFLYLMLTLEEEVSSTLNIDEPYMTQAVINSHSIMTRDVLVAAAFHYCDCVRARKAGVYDYARQALGMKHELTRLPLAEEVENDKSIVVKGGTMSRRTQLNSSIESYGEEITQIATSAATLKRAEIMATTIKSKGIGKIKSQSKTSQQTNVDAEILRSFMVSLSEDWRALVIRSAACLYRLKGISDGSNVDDGELSGSIVLSKSTVSVAKDALRVHAPLAQRLGMQRLKSELENCAFKILYPRQFAVASSLYRDMDEMKTIVEVLTTRIEQLLRSDPMFAAQIQDVTVTSRVKEPYSLWKKMIRIRKQAIDEAKEKRKGGSPRSPPSLKWVPDTIALRVVLSAARTSSLEDDESLRTREKLLCYYALQLIESIWVESEANERKDYIKNPKPNGYQSLHYTAKLVIVGEEWPFEVQIRSEEMHRIAEFGVAAHWDYKHKPKMMLPAAQESTPPMLALPSSEQVAITSSSSLVTARKKKKGRVASYIEALAKSREAIVQNNVFVFLSSTESALDGTIISVNSSAKVSDVLKQYVKLDRDDDDSLDLDEIVVYQNGVRVRLDTLEKELSNGDVLTVTSGILYIN